VFYKDHPLRFECTRCGACCTGRPDEGVFISNREAERIRAFLDLSQGWFRRRYLKRLSRSEWEVRLQPDGACPFLSEQGACTIYGVRPAQCVTYPFWPEIVASAASWKREARRCEGIGRGAVVPVAHIEAMLKRSGGGDG
jgi:Fe-S-cluster containining protein